MQMNRRRSISVTLCVTALLLLVVWPGAAGPARLTIIPGVGIGPLALGMRAGQVPRVLRKEVTPKVSGDRVIYDFPALGLTAWATDDYVVRVRSKHAFHKTAAGIHPGQIWSDGILGMCGGMVLTSELSAGVEFSCPFAGISFEVNNGRITGIAVTRPARR
jgi:hypothetical protein